MEPKEKDTPAGVGPGITGASGDLIDATGHDSGVGGTGHDNEQDAAGMRPQDRYTATPDEQGSEAEGARTSRQSGSNSGTVGGGGPRAVPSEGDQPGRAGGGGSGALGDVPGGVRNVSPANDRASDSDDVHEGEGQNRSDRINHIRAGNPGTEDEH